VEEETQTGKKLKGTECNIQKPSGWDEMMKCCDAMLFSGVPMLTIYPTV
jgi:hypothetical protein